MGVVEEHIHAFVVAGMLVSLYKSDLCGIIYKTLGAQKTWWLENRQISIILTAVQGCSVSAGALEGKNGPS